MNIGGNAIWELMRPAIPQMLGSYEVTEKLASDPEK